jgi:CubicO group peptidase (beta-lactamase class C family)
MTFVVFFITIAAPAAQVVRTGGPPPEVRAVFDALLAAANGGSEDAWEAFAQARFSQSFLQKQSRDERAQFYRQLADQFGTVAIEGVRREGPDAPLRMMVKGSKANGVILLSLDAGSPPRIDDLRLGSDAAARDAAGGGVPAPPIDPSMTSAEIDRRLDDYFTRLAADEAFSGVALVARNGVPVFFKAYGLADREKKVANTIRTRFNLGSINKAFTQVAIRQLVAAGKLSLTDTLGKFFPDYPQAASRGATVEQLLGHRAGLSDFFGPQFNNAPKSQFASNADYFRFVSSLPPAFAPGERQQYCNGCYIALGAIVERVSGMPYEKYVAEHVFARAEMTSTGYPRSDRPEPDIALGYTRRGSANLSSQALRSSSPQALVNNIALHGVTGSAAGGGYSTALDLLTYVKAVRAGKFPGADADMGIAGGAPGINAIVEARGEWVVIVMANFDPPAASQVGMALANALDK